MDGTTGVGSRPGILLTRIGVGLLLLVVTLVILRPFLVPAVWAATIAYMTWGPYARARRALGRPRAAAGLFTLAVFLSFGVPAVWLAALGIDETIRLVGVAQQWVKEGAPLPGWLTGNPWLGPRVGRLLEQPMSSGALGPRLLAVGGTLTQQIVAMAGGVAENAFAFLFTLITLFVFYADGERVASHVRALFAYVFPERPPDYIDRVGGLVRAVVAGVLGTAVVQGVAAAVGFAIFGVPYAIGLGALTSLLAFLPGGTFATTLAAVAWLAMEGGRASAVGMLLWGVLVVGTLDSWLRPLLISRSGAGEIPFLLVLFGVLGGLAAFGLPGLLFGPVVLAVVFALIVELPGEAPAGDPSAAPAAPALHTEAR
jgi:predicted PurR-regulated permease PerM